MPKEDTNKEGFDTMQFDIRESSGNKVDIEHPIYEMADPNNCHYQRMSVFNCAITISTGRE